MSAAPEYPPGRAPGPPAGLAGLLAMADAAVGALADDADLAAMADEEAAAVMGTLTTMVARLDSLRVGVAQVVRDRELYSQRGARSLAGWLRADTRLADEAWQLGRLAAAARQLPKITTLLGAGKISMAQAATACWQITQLPDLPCCPGQAGPGEAPDIPGSLNHADDTRPDGEPADDPRWAGLWRLGDVHAAADELFSNVLPRLDCAGLRHLGAHLREAADAQQRAADDHSDFVQRGLRISRSLGGCGEITGRLHAEAAEQVIAAFEELGAKTGPDDPRTKAQRWADVLTRLAQTATAAPAVPAPTDPADQPCPPGADGTGHDYARCRGNGSRGGGHAAGRVTAGYQRPRLIITVPLATLLGQPLAPGATVLGSGTPLTAWAARRLACDAGIVRLVTGPQLPSPSNSAHASTSGPPGSGPPGKGPPSSGPPGSTGNATHDLTARLAAGIAQLPPPLAGPSATLDIGRASPAWTQRQRDALAAQYGGRCAHPGCTGPIDVVHHLVHWADGGPTSIANGFPCCAYHHWLIHEGGWRVRKHADGTITAIPPPPGWRPGTIYRHGTPVHEFRRPGHTPQNPP